MRIRIPLFTWMRIRGLLFTLSGSGPESCSSSTGIDPQRLHFEPPKHLSFYFNADPDPDPAFHSNRDPDPSSQNVPDLCGSGSATQRTLMCVCLQGPGRAGGELQLWCERRIPHPVFARQKVRLWGGIQDVAAIPRHQGQKGRRKFENLIIFQGCGSGSGWTCSFELPNQNPNSEYRSDIPGVKFAF